jgi:hypothetical protein
MVLKNMKVHVHVSAKGSMVASVTVSLRNVSQISEGTSAMDKYIGRVESRSPFHQPAFKLEMGQRAVVSSFAGGSRMAKWRRTIRGRIQSRRSNQPANCDCLRILDPCIG